MLKLMAFSDILTKESFVKDQVLYDNGDVVDNVYFVKKGNVKLEIFYVIEYITSVPLDKHTYERC